MFRLFEDYKKGVNGLLYIVWWLCPHTANTFICKYHIKVNFASDDPFKKYYAVQIAFS